MVIKGLSQGIFLYWTPVLTADGYIERSQTEEPLGNFPASLLLSYPCVFSHCVLFSTRDYRKWLCWIRARKEKKSLLTQDTSERKEKKVYSLWGETKWNVLRTKLKTTIITPNTYWSRRTGVTEKEQRVIPTQAFKQLLELTEVSVFTSH